MKKKSLHLSKKLMLHKDTITELEATYVLGGAPETTPVFPYNSRCGCPTNVPLSNCVPTQVPKTMPCNGFACVVTG